ncbi:MAG: hypothetical protein MHMPM18_002478, partial [Marteilia pararefringens]
IDDSFLHINLDCYLSAIIDYLQLYTRRASIVQPKFDLVDMQGDLQHIHQLPNTLKGKDTHLSNQDEYAIVIFNDNSGQDCSGCRISVDILTQRGFRGKYCQVLSKLCSGSDGKYFSEKLQRIMKILKKLYKAIGQNLLIFLLIEIREIFNSKKLQYC